MLQPVDLQAGNGLAEVLLNERQKIPNTRNGYCTGIFFGGKTRDFPDESKSLNPAMRSGSVYAACSPGSWPGKCKQIKVHNGLDGDLPTCCRLMLESPSTV